MEQKVITILNEICGADEGEIDADFDLFDAGLLDSFGIIELLLKLEEELGVSLDMEALTREEIATPSRIVAKLQEQS